MSLVSNLCDHAENNLKIINLKPENKTKERFGVCIPALTLEKRESVIKFIEWIEMMKILGAAKVHISNRLLHPELLKVAKYYEQQGLVEITTFHEPSTFDNLIYHNFWTFQYLTINDCFYRVKNLYDYVLIIDTNEVVLPMKQNDETWHDLFQRLNESEKTDAFMAQSVSYSFEEGEKFENIPEYQYMLTHVEVRFNILSLTSDFMIPKTHKISFKIQISSELLISKASMDTNTTSKDSFLQ